MTLSEPSILSSTSQFQAEPVEGRRVSKVVKTTMVHGERMEKSLGDSSLATDLPSAKEDFEEVQKHWFILCLFSFRVSFVYVSCAFHGCFGFKKKIICHCFISCTDPWKVIG